MRKLLITIMLVVFIAATATCSYATEINYTAPKGFSTSQVVHDDEDILSETRMSKGGLNIDITVYKNTKKNNKEIYQNLNGRTPKKVVVDGITAREGFTDIDHMIAFENGNHIVELFASRTGTAFSGEEYSQLDEIVFQQFLDSVVVK